MLYRYIYNIRIVSRAGVGVGAAAAGQLAVGIIVLRFAATDESTRSLPRCLQWNSPQATKVRGIQSRQTAERSGQLTRISSPSPTYQNQPRTTKVHYKDITACHKNPSAHRSEGHIDTMMRFRLHLNWKAAGEVENEQFHRGE